MVWLGFGARGSGSKLGRCLLIGLAFGAMMLAQESELANYPALPTEPKARLDRLLSLTEPLFATLPPAELLIRADEAVRLTETLGLPAKKVQALRSLGFAALSNKDFPRALETYFQARDLASSLGDQTACAQVEMDIGDVFQFCYADYPTALAYYRKGFQWGLVARSLHWQVLAQRRMGDIYTLLGEYPTATQHLKEALSLSQDTTEYRILMSRAAILVNLSQINIELEDMTQAELLLTQAQEIFARPGYYQEFGKSRVYIQWGHIHRHQKRYPEALQNYRLALEIRAKRTNVSEIASLWHLLGDTEREAGRPQEALVNLMKALEMRRSGGEALGIAESNLAIGLTFAQMQRPREALPFLLESLEASSKGGFNKERTQVYQALSSVHAALGDAQASLRYRNLFDEWKDRVQGSRVTAAVLGILNRYEKDQLDRELRLLRTHQSRTLRLVGIIGAILGLVILGLLLNLRRLKAWRAEHLQRRKEEWVEQLAQLDAMRLKLSELSESSELQEAPEDTEKPKYAASRLTEASAQRYIKRILLLYDEKRIYRDPDFTLDKLATSLNLSTTYLSQIFNQFLKQKFQDFTNAFRVKDVCQTLVDPANRDRSPLDLGFDAGFNSKTNYYRVFKQATGLTPIEYRSKNLKA